MKKTTRWMSAIVVALWVVTLFSGQAFAMGSAPPPPDFTHEPPLNPL